MGVDSAGVKPLLATTASRFIWFDFCFMALQHILGHFVSFLGTDKKGEMVELRLVSRY